MIERWREASGSVEGGSEKRTENTKDGRKSSTDGRGHADTLNISITALPSPPFTSLLDPNASPDATHTPPPPGVCVRILPDLGESGTLFASARVALRPTQASTTGSINDVARAASDKMRQPTVNVPSDKMAAFLNEMRTVQWRKVGSAGGLNRSVSDRPGPSGLSRSMTAVGVEGKREVEMGRRKSMGMKVPVGSSSTSKAGSGSAVSHFAAGLIGSSKLASTSLGLNRRPRQDCILPQAIHNHRLVRITYPLHADRAFRWTCE